MLFLFNKITFWSLTLVLKTIILHILNLEYQISDQTKEKGRKGIQTLELIRVLNKISKKKTE